MKRNLLFLFFVLFLLPESKACLNNYYSVDREGSVHYTNDILTPFNKNFNVQKTEEKLHKLEARLKKEHSYMLLSDYAVCLMKLGKVQEAVAILAELEVHYPNEFQVASNLGTAYELNGMPDSAAEYIRRGMTLNPNDHEGSEWIHLKILEAKLAMRQDPKWLETHSVLGLSAAQKNDTNVRNQLYIQLRERFPFTPGPDVFMAGLLEDLGDCFANTASLEYAKVLYMISKEYYENASPALAGKISEMNKLIAKYRNVKLPHESEYSEYSNDKLEGMMWKQYIDDNDKTHHVVNWSTINTDVKSLLALANLEMTVQQARAQAKENQEKNTDSLQYTGAENDPSVKAEPTAADSKSEEKGTGWLISVIGSVLILGGAYYFIRKSQKG